MNPPQLRHTDMQCGAETDRRAQPAPPAQPGPGPGPRVERTGGGGRGAGKVTEPVPGFPPENWGRPAHRNSLWAPACPDWI